MTEWVLMGLLVMLLGIRVASFLRLWKLPFRFGAERFFGLPVQARDAQPLLRRYRALLFVPYLPDAGCALAAFVWGGLLGLVVEQAVAFLLTQIYQTLLAIHIIRKAKWLAALDSWKPVRTVALSFKMRRLRDYTNRTFELILILLTMGALAFLIYQVRDSAVGETPFELLQPYALAALAIYLQLGGLLVKHALVRWRMWLPGERTEEYLRWREEVLRYFLWVCDFLRFAFTAALVTGVFAAYLSETEHRLGVLLLVATLVAGLITIWDLGVGRRVRRLDALHKELHPLEAFCSPPEEINDREFFLGGLCYCNAENPALFVPGPLVYAVNLANKRAYLYGAYLAGLVLLGFWCVGVPHS